MSIGRVTLLISAFNILSKFIAYIRELIFAYAFGTSSTGDIVRLCNAFILIPISFATTEIFNAGYVGEAKRLGYSEGGARKNLDSAYLLFSIAVGLIITALAFTFSADLAEILKIPSDHALLFESFYTITALSAPAITAYSFLSYRQLIDSKPLLFSIRSPILNFGFILGTIAYIYLGEISLIPLSYVLTWILAITVAAVTSDSAKLLTLRTLKRVKLNIFKIFVIWRTVIFLPVAAQLIFIIERVYAARSGTGIVSAVEISRIIIDSAIVIVATPIAQSIISYKGPHPETAAKLAIQKQLPILFMLLTPLTLFFAIDAHSLISILFERGKFNKESVEITSSMLITFLPGCFGFAITMVWSRYYSVCGDNRKYIYLLTIPNLLNIALLPLMTLHYDELGIGTSYSIAWSIAGIYSFCSLITTCKISTKNILLLSFIILSSLCSYGIAKAVQLSTEHFLLSGAIFLTLTSLAYISHNSLRAKMREYLNK